MRSYRRIATWFDQLALFRWPTQVKQRRFFSLLLFFAVVTIHRPAQTNPLPTFEPYSRKSRSPQAKFLRGLVLLEQRQYRVAAKLFQKLITTYPLLADYHRFFAARAYVALGRHGNAETLLKQIDGESPLSNDAQWLIADLLWDSDRFVLAASAYQTCIQRWPRDARAATARMRLATILLSQKPPQTDEAVRYLQQVIALAPFSANRTKAELQLKQLVQQRQINSEALQLPLADRFEQAQLYYRSMRNIEAEHLYQQLSKVPGLKPSQRCQALYFSADSIFKQRQQDRSVTAFEAAIAACKTAKQWDEVVKSIYKSAKGLMRQKRFDDATARLAELEKNFASHSYADDARLLAAEAQDAAGNTDAATALLSGIFPRYPKSDMVREALWRLARRAYLNDQFEVAEKYLNDTIEKLGRSAPYYAEGQAIYWKARIAQQTGRGALAATLYERCITAYPLTYYALLSFNQLQILSPADADRLESALLNQPKASPKLPRQWIAAAQAHPALQTAAFRRGVELARLGLRQHAYDELMSAGIEKTSWVAAYIFDSAGMWHISHQVPRSYDASYKTTYPIDDDTIWPWRIAYPAAWASVVRPRAAQNNIDDALVFAIMREESGFVVDIESYANAIGLMQLIVPTAKLAAQRIGLIATPESLRDPAVNIALGSAVLGGLTEAFGQSIPLAIAGYNAGRAAVYRWLKQNGTRSGGDKRPLDEFIELIPYDQTRRYTKRVLASYWTYRTLYGKGKSAVPKLW